MEAWGWFGSHRGIGGVGIGPPCVYLRADQVPQRTFEGSGGDLGARRADLGILEGCGGAGRGPGLSSPPFFDTFGVVQATHARLGRAVGAGHRPCRHCHPGEHCVPKCPQMVVKRWAVTSLNVPQMSPGGGGEVAVATAGGETSGSVPF